MMKGKDVLKLYMNKHISRKKAKNSIGCNEEAIIYLAGRLRKLEREALRKTEE